MIRGHLHNRQWDAATSQAHGNGAVVSARSCILQWRGRVKRARQSFMTVACIESSASNHGLFSMTTATPSQLCTTQVFCGARELSHRAARRSRQERGIDNYLADERAQRFERQEREELRRLFFDIVDEC
jgi:hypothetical protein